MVHEEPSYVVRQPDGTTLSFPAWMTELELADVKIVGEVHLPIVALLELRRLTTNALSSMHSSTNEGGNDVATSKTTKDVIRRARPDSSPLAPGGGKTRGNVPAGRVDAGLGEKHRCGGAK
jgi:hypothetical protein